MTLYPSANWFLFAASSLAFPNLTPIPAMYSMAAAIAPTLSTFIVPVSHLHCCTFPFGRQSTDTDSLKGLKLSR